jgi:hypothetical protein
VDDAEVEGLYGILNAKASSAADEARGVAGCLVNLGSTDDINDEV